MSQIKTRPKKKWNLPIEMFPSAFGSTEQVKQDRGLSSVNRELHRAIRNILVEREGKQGSACGYVPKIDKELHSHEVFEFEENLRVKRFVRCRLLCKTCHYLTHQGYWAFASGTFLKRIILGRHPDDSHYLERIKWQVEYLKHFCRVNRCTPEEAFDYATEASRANS